MQDNMQAEPSWGLLIFLLVFIIFEIVAGWKVYTKAGKPGWASIIPIYNFFVLVEIAGKPWWWFLLLFVPVVNFVIAFMMAMAIATNFGKGTGFAVGLFFLGAIFYPILAFGSATYTPPPEPA